MFSANPRIVPSARLLSRLDYEEAQEIATTGAKVLHPRCLNPLREAQVPLAVRDTNRPELAGTEIGASVASAAPSVKAVSERRGITLISMESIGMWQQVGFLADVFERFKRHGLSIDLISSAETNVTVSLEPSENLVNSDVLSALAADLAEVCGSRSSRRARRSLWSAAACARCCHDWPACWPNSIWCACTWCRSRPTI